ncbi:MAG: hypothetical protein ACREBC_26975, partial [Pyrinomonadaceae bacterium]
GKTPQKDPVVMQFRTSAFRLPGIFKSRCTTVRLKALRNWPCRQTMNANHEQLSTNEWRTW